MKVLVATAMTQGQRDNDCCAAVEGELVFVFPPCRVGEIGPDACRCARVFVGLVSQEISTTAVVADLPDVGRAEYLAAMRAGFQAQDFSAEFATDLGNSLADLVADWPVGTVVERRSAIVPRTVPATGRLGPPPQTDLTGQPAKGLWEPGEGGRPAVPEFPGQNADVSLALAQLTVPIRALTQIAAMVEAKLPDPEADRLYVDMVVDGRDVTIREHYARSSLRPQLHQEWITSPVARLRYLRTLGLWQLFWNGRTGKWWTYPHQERSADIGILLEEIRSDQHQMFWS
ncbi:MAG: DUF3024 domain-containing protein [Actinomycetota bacterium]|nr:DUF3024 domain-containing protein [Actinomycetota bacterium]